MQKTNTSLNYLDHLEHDLDGLEYAENKKISSCKSKDR